MASQQVKGECSQRSKCESESYWPQRYKVSETICVRNECKFDKGLTSVTALWASSSIMKKNVLIQPLSKGKLKSWKQKLSGMVQDEQ